MCLIGKKYPETLDAFYLSRLPGIASLITWQVILSHILYIIMLWLVYIIGVYVMAGLHPLYISYDPFTLSVYILWPVYTLCVLYVTYSPLTPSVLLLTRISTGTFEEERAGKRMKLPIPETWETQISMRGNKAEVWEQLLGETSSWLIIPTYC